MKAWLCGLDDDELSSVSSVLTFIGIDHSTSFTSLHLPDFVVIGQSVESIELDEFISIVSLNPTLDILSQDNVWFCPLPWRS